MAKLAKKSFGNFLIIFVIEIIQAFSPKVTNLTNLVFYLIFQAKTIRVF